VRKAPVRKAPKPTRRVVTAKPKRTVLAAPPRATVSTDAASSDTLLLIGGLALFVLVLGDTVFLTLSTRFLGGAR
jgi:hypothetical protein